MNQDRTNPDTHYVSGGFTLRSRHYPVGASLDHIDASELAQLIRNGHAVVVTPHPAPNVETTEE